MACGKAVQFLNYARLSYHSVGACLTEREREREEKTNIYIYTSTHRHTHMHTHLHTYLYASTYIFTYMYTHAPTYILIYKRTYICTGPPLLLLACMVLVGHHWVIIGLSSGHPSLGHHWVIAGSLLGRHWDGVWS